MKLKGNLSAEETEKARKATLERTEQSEFGIVMLERGIGLGYDGLIISLYRNYSEFAQHIDAIKAFTFIDCSKTETFLVNLEDNVRYRPLSFQAIAMQLVTRERERNSMAGLGKSFARKNKPGST